MTTLPPAEVPPPLTPPPLTMNEQSEQATAILLKKNQDGASWFFWIAGLSLVNSVVILAGSNWSFLVGLGVTQIIDGLALAVAEEVGAENGRLISLGAFFFDAVVAGSFVLWGVLARRQHRWAYVVGMLLYALDGLIFLVFQDFPSFGFHLFALFCLFKGFQACGQIKKIAVIMEEQGQA